jgi:hypothetical protein
MTEHLTDVVIDPRDTAANREPGWWRDATLYNDVAAAARHPDKVTIVGHSPRRLYAIKRGWRGRIDATG